MLIKMNLKDRQKIKKLKDYFSKHNDVVLAFVFGSRAVDRQKPSSDWDIGIYFKPKNEIEIETTEEYKGETEIRGEVENILKAENDVVVLNRARPSLVFIVLNSGIPLAIKDDKLRLELIIKTHYEAVDFWNFTQEFWQIREKAASLTPEARSIIIERLTFLENEFSDFDKIKNISQQEYMENRDTKRNIERWIENIVMSSLDIAKVVLASEKKEVPQTYRETLRMFGISRFGEQLADKFSEFADLRNVVAHEYLDIRWKRIQKFIEESEKLCPLFIEKIKEII